MEGNIHTIEDLAALIMETMASKEDIKEVKDEMKGLATKEDVQELCTEMNERFEKVDARLDHLDARVGRIEANLHALRDEVVYRHDFEDVLDRVKYIEKKLGIESGV